MTASATLPIYAIVLTSVAAAGLLFAIVGAVVLLLRRLRSTHASRRARLTATDGGTLSTVSSEAIDVSNTHQSQRGFLPVPHHAAEVLTPRAAGKPTSLRLPHLTQQQYGSGSREGDPNPAAISGPRGILKDGSKTPSSAISNKRASFRFGKGVLTQPCLVNAQPQPLDEVHRDAAIRAMLGKALPAAKSVGLASYGFHASESSRHRAHDLRCPIHRFEVDSASLLAMSDLSPSP